MIIDENHPWYLPEGFIEKTENDDYLLYADTDSAYLLYDLPFDKYQNIHQLVDYIQGIARELGTIYNDALNYYVGNFANMNPEYNTMDFKSEVVAYKGFFNTKKFYSLAKCWDEGTFFEGKPKLKTTGGQIKKSDVTQITKKLLDDIYALIVTDLSQTNLDEMYRIIFIELKNKYKLQIMDDIKQLNFKSFSIPKKWGSTEKTIPPFVMGAKLFNCIIDDTFRPSDSFIVVKVHLDIERLKEYIKNNKIRKDKYILQLSEVESLGDKLKNISLPPDMTSTQKEKLISRMEELNIRLDYDEIISFNIDMKIEPFEKLFSDDVKMRVL